MHAFLPAAAIVRRELVSFLRLRRTYCFMSMLLLLAVTYAMVNWPRMNQLAGSSTPLAQAFYVQLFGLLFFGCALFVPAVASVSVVNERNQRTFDMLAMTHVRPTWFVLAKMAASTCYFVLVLMSAMPILGLAFYLVGLDLHVVPLGALVTVSSMFACASAGVLCSCLFRRAEMCAAAGYLAMLTLQGMPLFLLSAVTGLFTLGGRSQSLTRFPYILPIRTLLMLPSGRGGYTASVVCITSQVCAGLVCLFLAQWIVRKTWGSTSTSPNPERRAPRTVRTARDHSNPMGLKERLGRGAGGIWSFFLALATCLAATLILAALRRLSPYNYLRGLQGWLLLQSTLAALITPAFFANLVAKEYDHGTMDGLRMTLLPPRAILRGKAWSGARPVLALWGAVVLSALPLLLTNKPYPKETWFMLKTGYPTTLAVAGLAGSVTLFCAQWFRRMNTTLVVSYAVILMGLAGNYAIAAFLSDRSPLSSVHGGLNWEALWSPLAAFGNTANSMRYHRPQMTIWGASIAGHTLFAILLYALSEWSFIRRHMRSV